MITDRGLYIHVPFCKKKCNYCDFCSLPAQSRERIGEYVERLVLEMQKYKRENRVKISTVYFGGGTPTLLEISEYEKILNAAKECFDIKDGAEITTELNPGTVTKEKLQSLKKLGVNRLSIGLQSIHENELKRLGRIHSFEDFLKVYQDARALGFSNVSVDLMYGIPEQTLESFKQTLNRIIELSPEHISAYGLIIEEGTPFYEQKESLNLPSADTECDMYEICCRQLRDAGYNHYEISNYSKHGFESKHNLLYWRNMEYIGIGASAYSYFGGKRYGNTRVLHEYFSENYEKYICYDEQDEPTRRFEYAMMRLRLREGLSLSEYESLFGTSFVSGKEDFICKLSEQGLVRFEDDRLSLTDKGMYVSNSILTELL